MSYEKFDELSFGEEREPWLQTWVAAHWWVFSIAVATAVVLAGLGTGGWYLHRQSLLPYSRRTWRSRPRLVLLSSPA